MNYIVCLNEQLSAVQDRIARGEQQLAAIVGGEASHSRARAKKERASLNWTPMVRREDSAVVPGSRMTLHPLAKALGVTQPAQIYPFYEVAAQAAWGQSPEEGNRESAASWEIFAAVAGTNDKAWLRTAPDRETIAAATFGNRMICWPYRKLMVANPNVNQAGAVLVASLGLARKAGVPEDRLIFIWGGRDQLDFSVLELRSAAYLLSAWSVSKPGRSISVA